MDVAKLKVAELKRELKARGLSTTGNKQELVDRLQASMETSGDGSLVMDDDANVVCLVGDEEDDDEDDEDLSEPSANNSTLNISMGSPLSETTPISSSEQSFDLGTKRHTSKDDSRIPHKKIVLNRSNLPAVEKENMDGKDSKDDLESLTDDPLKTVKLSQVELSAKQRLELRAKKFGSSISDTGTSKADARAARFKLAAGSTKTLVVAPPLDVLKKRAERFGSSVSSVMEKAEIEERKKKRQERFGISEPVNVSPKTIVTSNIKIRTSDGSTTANSQSGASLESTRTSAGSKRVPITAPSSSTTGLDDKKKMRAERFKIQ